MAPMKQARNRSLLVMNNLMPALLFFAQDPEAAVYAVLALSYAVAAIAVWKRWHGMTIPCHAAAALAYAMVVALHAWAHLPPPPAPPVVVERLASLPPIAPRNDPV